MTAPRAAGTSPAGLDLARLADHLARDLELSSPDLLQAEIVDGGKSNLTAILREGDREWVLRRPPLGPALPTAHSMRREYTVLRALQDSEVPVPRVFVLCEDEGVIGAPFYVMERVRGRVIRGVADFDLTPAEARRCALALVRTLADLHTAPYAQLGLGDFGRPDGFMERQVRRWHEQLERSRIRPLPDLDELGRRVRASVPEATAPALVHGDFRIDNVMLDEADAGRIVAVLDWEMATVGEPLADVGMLLVNWGEPGRRFATDVEELMAQPGFLTRDEVVAEYGARAGHPPEHLDFYVAFAHFKLAVIVEGIHARHEAGQTVGEGFERIGEIGPLLAARGLGLIA